MMKKNFYFLLMAALVCGLSLSVTSCKDDDKNNNNEEEEDLGPQATQNEAATKFWSVVGQLVDIDDVTEDYKNGSFEPTIGEEVDGEPQTRVVYVNDAAAAAERFANLVGVDNVDETTPSRSWSDPDVGTLTYTKGDGVTAWATVEVNIKQVPHLTKIIYRSPDQNDENAKKPAVAGGKIAYYRFGDVVSRTVKNKDNTTTLEYWICVRPAFAPEGKPDTYWACVSQPLPLKNQYIWKYDNVNKDKGFDVHITYVLPTGLGENKAQMQNFAEMLYAITCPDNWYNALVSQMNNKKVKMFQDFKKDYLYYHNEKFWKNVQKAWSINGKFFEYRSIVSEIFGFRLENDPYSSFANLVSGGRLKLLYKGYSWVSGSAPKLYQASYNTGTKDAELNNHLVKYSEVKKSVYDKKNPKNDIELNVTEDVLGRGYYYNWNFFGDDDPRYIVRIATGAELSSTGKYPDNRKAIPGVTEVYRYYRDVEKPADEMPEVTQNIIRLN